MSEEKPKTCLHNHLNRSAVSPDGPWFWVCADCGEFFEIKPYVQEIQFGTEPAGPGSGS